MAEPLAFKSIEFSGYDSMETTGPNSYTIYRKAGSNLMFKAELNRAAVPRDEEDGTMYQAYPGWTLEYIESNSEYKSFWSSGSWYSLRSPPGESEAHISACLNKRSPAQGEASFGVSVKIITQTMTAEERQACTHPSSMSSEGQCWGGGSGSCTVEIITSCSVCGATLSTSFDHRD